MNYLSLDQLPNFIPWLTIIIAVISVVGWIIKMWNTTPLQLLYEPRHKKVSHNFSIVIIISSFIFLVFLYFSFQTAEYIGDDFLGFIGLLAIFPFLGAFLFILGHYFVLIFREKVVVRKNLCKSVAAIGLLSLLALNYCINAIHVQKELYTIEQLPIITIQLLFLIIYFLTIPIYIRKIEKAGYYFEIEIIPEEDQYRLPKKMVFQYSIREDIQVMSLPHTKGKDILTQDTFYEYHLQTKQFQRIEGKRI
ncbi:hypothetical protein AN965_04420 [Alkalicoccobacillus plakortidis]|uniref:Uncharacterized protein n=1 Tax=Alkalicoccobacillus plakortidis TaxID=444060 RepID=A0A9D5DQ76_9BACI|nr:hypothetical protein [Alkalicoccobacillus plakortidis]KQL58308.1 hypothetical protein AN965_04420 [Alkalicoccobacillus plakortidis]